MSQLLFVLTLLSSATICRAQQHNLDKFLRDEENSLEGSLSKSQWKIIQELRKAETFPYLSGIATSVNVSEECRKDYGQVVNGMEQLRSYSIQSKFLAHVYFSHQSTVTGECSSLKFKLRAHRGSDIMQSNPP